MSADTTVAVYASPSTLSNTASAPIGPFCPTEDADAWDAFHTDLIKELDWLNAAAPPFFALATVSAQR